MLDHPASEDSSADTERTWLKKGFKLVKCEESVLLSLQVILSPDAAPPVVRIMDYNKYRYELQKKKRVQQRKSAGKV
uniref:Translation initiation factor 3 N-terminal domain-containing protein n=1 Tax=Manihot esculenta TaxID=3983 RepID=A0A2C9VPJ8_MANES